MASEASVEGFRVLDHEDGSALDGEIFIRITTPSRRRLTGTLINLPKRFRAVRRLNGEDDGWSDFREHESVDGALADAISGAGRVAYGEALDNGCDRPAALTAAQARARALAGSRPGTWNNDFLCWSFDSPAVIAS